MLQKTPKPAFWKFVKRSAAVLFVAEAVAFAVSYGVWHRMNTNREFRQYMHDNLPLILEGFYKVGETFGSSRTREVDFTVWQKELDKKEQ